jgi:hypothetical protein
MTDRMSGVPSYQLRASVVFLVILIAAYKVFSLAPISQNLAYHQFADTAGFGGIPNICNVLSNVGFIFAGIYGLKRCLKLGSSQKNNLWSFFFAAVIAVGIGSAYYHWQPSNNTLFWDRLPMTLAFGSLFACFCSERFGARFGRRTFLFTIHVGALSAVYWWVSEALGNGDLRLYILIQYLPMVLIPLILVLFPGNSGRDRMYWMLLLAYLLAKIFEIQDTAIYNFTSHLMSGHSLKHLVAAAGILVLQPLGHSENVNSQG